MTFTVTLTNTTNQPAREQVPLAEGIIFYRALLPDRAGALECTYHSALYELMATAAENPDLGDHSAELQSLVEARRLRDISDLPFDLAL